MKAAPLATFDYETRVDFVGLELPDSSTHPVAKLLGARHVRGYSELVGRQESIFYGGYSQRRLRGVL